MSLYLVNTSNFTVPCTVGVIYNNLANQNGAGTIATGQRILYGQQIETGNTKIGDSVDKMSTKLAITGAWIGILEAQIFTGAVDSSSKTLSQTSIESLDEGDLTSSQTDYVWTFADTHTVSAGDCYVVKMTTNTDSSMGKHIDIGYYNSTTAGTKIVSANQSSPNTFYYNSPAGYSMSHKVEATCP